MFQSRQKARSDLGTALAMFEVVYHVTVRSVRQSHNNAVMALVLNMMQSLMFLLAFYLMFATLGLRAIAIRGDFVLYMVSGIFLFMVHIKAMGAVAGAAGSTSSAMLIAPMSTAVSILSTALSALYINVLGVVVILSVYYTAFQPFVIEDPIGAFGMFLLAWFTGVANGVLVMALKPWAPSTVGVVSSFYKRINMLASGKMVVANSLPNYILPMFIWNPLFHVIDQARGYMFINYTPRVTSWEYAFWVGIVVFMLGIMAEFYTRQYASASWGARR